MTRSRRTRTAVLAAVAVSAGLVISALAAPGGASAITVHAASTVHAATTMHAADAAGVHTALLADAGSAVHAPSEQCNTAPDYLPCITDPTTGSYFPWMLNEDPYIPTSIAQLKQSPEPTCTAPALPQPTDADSPDGYTVPALIKLTNGVVLAGYSDTAYNWGTGVPFSIVMSGLTGWIVARVSLPSLQIHVDPADVDLCDGALAKAFEVTGATDEAGQASHVETQPDGTRYLAYLGSLSTRIQGMDGMDLQNAVAQQVQASITGVAPDGSLQLSTSLTASMDTNPPLNPDGSQAVAFLCKGVTVDGTFSTAPKAIVTATPPVIQETARKAGGTPPNPLPPYPVDVPAPQHQVYLPTNTLTGAVRGGTATIGSNWFDVQIPKYVDPTGSGVGSQCGGGANTQFYGYADPAPVNFPLAGLVKDATGKTLYSISPVLPAAGVPIVPGLTDLSMDVTIDQLGGLPTGLPSGYGFR